MRRAGAGRQENGAGVLSRETTQQSFEFQDFKGELVALLIQVLHVSAGNEGFLQLFVCWSFAVPADLSRIVAVLLWWRGGSAEALGNAVVFLKGLPSSHPTLSSQG